jgi:hypothetical protein
MLQSEAAEVTQKSIAQKSIIHFSFGASNARLF